MCILSLKSMRLHCVCGGGGIQEVTSNCRRSPRLNKSYCPPNMQMNRHAGKMELSFYQPTSI